MTVQQVATTSTTQTQQPAKDVGSEQSSAPAHPVPLPTTAGVAPTAKPVAEQTSAEYAVTLTGGRQLNRGAYDVPLAELPVPLQALVRFIRRGVADVSGALAAAKGDETKIPTQRLRGRLQTGARSWHQDSKKKVPDTVGEITKGSVAEFFASWFVGFPKPFPTKQVKKGDLSDRLLREYTATGWKEAEQLGRLIYDPIDDVLYLTVLHYKDDSYVRIVGDVTGHGPAAIAANHGLTPADLELLCFEAWSALEMELDELTEGSLAASAAAAAPGPATTAKASGKASGKPTAKPAAKPSAKPSAKQSGKQPVNADTPPAKKSAEPDGPDAPAPGGSEFDTLDPKVQEALKVLHVARQDYIVAFDAARNEEKFLRDKATRVAKQKKEEPAAESSSAGEVTAPFVFRGTTFHVGHKAGYIGFIQAPRGRPQRGAPAPTPVFPEYTQEATTVDDVTKVFQQCLTSAPGSNKETALMLAALVAESSRHRSAMVESVLVAVGHAGLGGKSQKAFGTALPMATGGTIATGGVAASVLARESATARTMALRALEMGEDEHALHELLAPLAPAERVPVLVAALRKALSGLS